MKILYLFGPNLGALGTRDPQTYGPETLAQIMDAVSERGRTLGHDVSWRQSDHEGALVGWLLAARAEEVDAIVVNPGALTHYSYALRDANIAVNKARGMFDPVIDGLPRLGVLGVLLVGVYRVSSGGADAGDVVQVAFLFTLIGFPIRALGWVLGELPRSVVGWDRIQRVLTAEGGSVSLEAAALADGRMKFYEVELPTGHARFFAIQAGGEIHTNLDACEICGPLGYFQEGSALVCRNCTSPIAPMSLDRRGGCNPIPIAHRADGGRVVVDVATLEAALPLAQGH